MKMPPTVKRNCQKPCLNIPLESAKVKLQNAHKKIEILEPNMEIYDDVNSTILYIYFF